jgi:transforming growth factor-beta-induced protein
MSRGITMKVTSLFTMVAVGIMASTASAQDCPFSKAHTQTISTTATTQATATAQADIVDTAVSAGKFKTLVAAAKAAGLVDTLKSKGPLTVLAPTDTAFKKLPAGTVESLLKEENREKLQAILKYHVIAGKVMSGDVVKLNEAKTVGGQTVKIDTDTGTVMFNNAKLLNADIACSNGVIHVIDTVLLPSAPASETKTAAKKMDIVATAASAGSFNTLLAAAKAAGLVEVLQGKGPLTVLAPTDDAFKKLPKGTVESLLKEENREQLQNILKYHVIAGNVKSGDVVKLTEAATVAGLKVQIKAKDGVVTFDKAKLLKADIECTNGVVHVIDSVLIPAATPDVVDTAVAAGQFKTLVAAVKAAGLVETLKGDGPFTVFAPTDEAFKKIPAETLQALLKPENKDKLTSILTYHVVSGNVLAADVVKLSKAKTVNGKEVTVKVSDGDVMIDNAKVLKTDIKCGNGVIHVIDTVIMPE